MERGINGKSTNQAHRNRESARLLILPVFAGALLFAWTLAPQRDAAVTAGPFLQSPTPRSVILRWQTDRPTESAVEFADEATHLSRTVRRSGLDTDHEVRLAGLEPNTTYWFRIATGHDRPSGHPTGPARFRTPPPVGSTNAFRVWIGDPASQGSSHHPASIRNAAESHGGGVESDLILWLGDVATLTPAGRRHHQGGIEFLSGVETLIPVWPTPGNHSARPYVFEDTTLVFERLFSLPTQGEAGGIASKTESYYSFDHGNAHFICLDSQETDRSPFGDMMEWLEHDLADTRRTWIVAFWHHPPYGTLCSDPDHCREPDKQRMREMRENALPLLEQAGADLVICGHSDAYRRTDLIHGHDGTENPFTASLAIHSGDEDPNTDRSYHKFSRGGGVSRGTLYLTVGHGGDSHAEKRLPPSSAARCREAGSVFLDFDGDRMDAVFLNAEAKVRDRFSISKSPERALKPLPAKDP